MFSKYICKILRALSAVVALLAVVGCSDDIGVKPDYTRSGEEVEIKVSVSLPKMDVQTRADLDDNSLNQVNSLWIRTYSADSGKATSDWIVVADPLPTTDTEVARPVTFRTQSGRSFIVAVANVDNNGVTSTSLNPTPLRELLDDADTWQKFLDIAAVTPSSYQNVRAPQPPLTMAGCFSDVIVGTEPTNIADWQTKDFQSYFIPAQEGTRDLTDQGAIHMRRLVSHVNFNFIPAEDLTVTVNSYQVMNAPRFSWLYERPSVNGMVANFGDLIDSEDKIATYFTDVPQYNSQFVTENQDGSSSFDFWQGESKHEGTAESYGDRGKLLDANENHFASLGDVWTPNNEASYVLVNCTVEYKNTLNVHAEGVVTPGGTTVNRTGEVTYLIHLGAVGGVMTDFNCYRNANYTYNVTVNGINDIRLDAYATDETFHNEEGMVVDITRATIDIDAHQLRHGAQACARRLADIRAAHADAALVHIVKAHEQIDHCRLAAARRADDRHTLAGFYREIEIADKLLLRRVGKCNILQRNISVHGIQNNGVLCLRQLRLLCDQLENTGRAGQRVLQLGHDAGNLVERLCVLVGIAQKTGELADRDPAGNRRERARQADAGIYEAVDKARRRVGRGGKEDRLQRAFFQPVVDLVKALEHLVLLAERLYHLLVPQHFVDQSGLLAARPRLELEHRVGLLGDERRYKQGDRRDKDDDERDFAADGDHEQQRAEDRDNPGKQLCEAHQKAVRELIDIGDDTTHDIAVGMAVDIFERKNFDFVERLAADVADHIVRDPVVADVHQPLGQRRAEHDDHDSFYDGKDRIKCHPALVDNVVDCVAGQDWHIERQGDRCRRAENGERDKRPVRADVAQHLQQGLPVFLFYCFLWILHALAPSPSSFLNWE